MRKRIFTTLIAVAALAAGTWAVAAWAQGDDDAARRPRRAARGESLDLTADQKAKMEAIHTGNMKAMARLRADVQVARIELGELLRQKAPDTKAVKKAVDALTAAEGKVIEARASHRVAVHGVLTDEQFAKVRAMGGPGAGMGPRGRMGRGMRGPAGMGVGPRFQHFMGPNRMHGPGPMMWEAPVPAPVEP